MGDPCGHLPQGCQPLLMLDPGLGFPFLGHIDNHQHPLFRHQGQQNRSGDQLEGAGAGPDFVPQAILRRLQQAGQGTIPQAGQLFFAPVRGQRGQVALGSRVGQQHATLFVQQHNRSGHGVHNLLDPPGLFLNLGQHTLPICFQLFAFADFGLQGCGSLFNQIFQPVVQRLQLLLGFHQFCVAVDGCFVGGDEQSEHLLLVGSNETPFAPKDNFDAQPHPLPRPQPAVCQNLAHVGQQVPIVIGFGDEIIGATGQPLQHILRVGEGGQENDRNLLTLLFAFDPVAQVKAVHFRHDNIADNQGRG